MSLNPDAEKIADLLCRLFRYCREERVKEAGRVVRVEIHGRYVLSERYPPEKQLDLDALRELAKMFDMDHNQW